MSEWGVVITRPGGEEMAAKELVGRGWRVYLPRYRRVLRGVRLDAEGRRHRVRGGGEVVLRPLFPRYLFMEMVGGGWSEVAGGVPGVVGLVGGMVGGWWRPYVVGEEVVEEVREAERGGEFDEVRGDGVRRDLELGQVVRVSERHDLVGRLVSLGEEGRARVLVELLGRSVEVRVSAGGLVAVGEGK